MKPLKVINRSSISYIYEREIGALDHSTAALPFVSDEKNLGGPIGSDAPELMVEEERPFTLHARLAIAIRMMKTPFYFQIQQ